MSECLMFECLKICHQIIFNRQKVLWNQPALRCACTKITSAISWTTTNSFFLTSSQTLKNWSVLDLGVVVMCHCRGAFIINWGFPPLNKKTFLFLVRGMGEEWLRGFYHNTETGSTTSVNLAATFFCSPKLFQISIKISMD